MSSQPRTKARPWTLTDTPGARLAVRSPSSMNRYGDAQLADALAPVGIGRTTTVNMIRSARRGVTVPVSLPGTAINIVLRRHHGRPGSQLTNSNQPCARTTVGIERRCSGQLHAAYWRLCDDFQVGKFRDWFGTPVAAGKTLVWLCWVSLLVAVFGGLIYVFTLGVLALLT